MQVRRTNFEVLRILSILMIIVFHCVHWSNIGPEMRIANRVILDLAKHGGEIGVCCFMLISGWFLPETKFRWGKFVSIFCMAVVYMAAEKAVLAAHGMPVEWSLKELLPVSNPLYWYVTVYIYIYLLTPAFGKMLPALSKKELGALVLSQLILWWAVPTILLGFIMGEPNTESMPYFNRYICMVVVYLEGYYLRRFGLPLTKRRLWFATLASFGMTALYVWAKDGGLLPRGRLASTFFWTPNSLLMLFMSTGLFLLFAGWEGPARGGRALTRIASCTLGIYLFHDGPIRNILWNETFPYVPGQSPVRVAFHLLFVMVVIFAVGLAIEWIRSEAEKRLVHMIRRVCTRAGAK